MDVALRHRIKELRATSAKSTVWRTNIPLKFDNRGEFHQIPSVWICLEGIIRVQGVTGVIDLHPGDTLYMEPGCWHFVQMSITSSAYLHIGFMPNWCDISVKQNNVWRIWKAAFQPLRAIIEGVFQKEGVSDIERTNLIDVIADETMTELSNTAYPIWAMSMGMWRLAYDPNVSAQDIWKKSGYSRGHSYRVFRATYGVGPARAIEIMRLDLARWLLHKGCKIADISRWCGFTNRRIFTKRWSAQFGKSPRAWKGKLVPLPEDGYLANNACRNIFFPQYLIRK